MVSGRPKSSGSVHKKKRAQSALKPPARAISGPDQPMKARASNTPDFKLPKQRDKSDELPFKEMIESRLI